MCIFFVILRNLFLFQFYDFPINMEREGGDKQKFHSNEYSCNFCEKSFLAKSRLIIYKRSHTGEKPFDCDTWK